MRRRVDGAIAVLTSDHPGSSTSLIRERLPATATVEAWALTDPPQQRLGDAVGRQMNSEPPTHIVTVRTGNGGSADLLADIPGVIGVWSCATTRLLSEPAREDDVARIAFARRRVDLDHEAFLDHYFDHHIPLVLAAGPLFSRYTVRALTDAPWDALVEQVFPDVETWNEHDRRLFEEHDEIRDDLTSFLGGIEQYAAVRLSSAAR